MTKEEKIKEVYLELYTSKKHLIDTDGWFNNSNENDAVTMGETNFLGECDYKNEYWFRPKTLKGIENNNNWIKLNTKVDLPNETGQYLTRRANGIIITEWFYDNNLSWYLWKDCYSITHYQPIIKPNEPLY